MSCPHTQNKAALAPLRAAQYTWNVDRVRGALDRLCRDDTQFHLCHPFGDRVGVDAFCKAALAPLKVAMPDVERRDWIVMAGESGPDTHWVGCGGHFMGTFVAPFLDIPPTGHLAHMRFHEFYRFEAGQIAEFQAVWDIPELMLQAGAWPLAPSLGREFCVPGPASGDGLHRPMRDADHSRESCAHVHDMLTHMGRHPAQGGPEVMEMARFWSEGMNWYGPAGIGTGRGIAGFRNWHQIPFLAGMPDREVVDQHLFADNGYVGATGWPNMAQTLSHDGWMGIAPTGRKITLRSLDFWRIETGRIRENWVLIDLLDVYRQLGVDVLARVREFNKARVPGTIPFLVEPT